MNHDEAVQMVVTGQITQDQAMTDEWDGLPYFTADNPMYPKVRVTLPPVAGAFEIVTTVSDAIRRREGHNAANWFENTAIEMSGGELMEFVRSTVTVSVS